MSNSGTTSKRAVQFKWFGQFRRDDDPMIDRDAASVQLEASLAREIALRQEIEDLVRYQSAQVEEFDHRLLNGIQMIVSLLSAQSRTASAEAAAQLAIAVNRILAFGHVHRRLHLLDRQESAELKQYLERLCEDLSGLLSFGMSDAIVVEGDSCSIPTTLGRPLGLIVSELITNSRKHGEGRIVVRLETPSPHRHLISVLDDGPGLPADFKPDESSRGLGMKIIRALINEIDGELRIVRGANHRGHFAISFRSPQ